MKKRIFWKSFGIFSLFAFLIFSHVGTNRSTRVAEASTNNIYLDFGSVASIWNDKLTQVQYSENPGTWAYFYGGGYSSPSWPGASMSKVSGNVYSIERPALATSVVFNVMGWQDDCQTVDLTLQDSKDLFTITTSYNNGNKQNGVWSTYGTPTVTYNVTMYIDGASVGSTQVPAGGIPNDYNPGFGKCFDGWYDSGHNAITAINADTSIYGYTETKETSTFAVDISEVSTTFTGVLNLYSWDENGQNANWPGVAIANRNEITVPYDAKVIINNGVVQTENVETIQNGKVLKILNSQDTNKKYLTEWTNTTPDPGPDPDPEDDHGQQIIYNSKYATYYQLLVYSFADGAGNDGIGDFKGIKDHLSYLVNLGIGGIYLSPVQRADSYHGYDITDYYSVNPDYEKGGYTLKNLVDDCHAAGIKVILDMVLNHSSWNCSWRTQHPNWYSGSDAFSGMIDFDFDNESLREEIKNVGKYWLHEYGVDGYRLDAVRWIYNTGSNEPTELQHEESVAWWHDFYEACKEEKEDVYMIGEDFVYDQNEIYNYQSSGLDSLFDFEMVNSITDGATLSRPSKYISYLVNHQMHIKGNCNYAIGASFLSNHDRGRYGSNLEPKQYTLASLMNILAPGNSYIYYGDELNLQVTKSGGYDDFAYRTPMPFASETTNMNSYLKGFGGGVKSVTSLPYGGGTADQKAASDTSIYAAYAKAVALKNHNPILYSGTTSVNGNNQDETIGSYFISEDDTTLTVIYNTSNKIKNIAFDHNITLLGDISYEGSASVNGNQLIMAPYSVVVLNGREALAKTPKTGLYVRGSMNSWEANEEYELTTAWLLAHAGKITNLTINANEEFKIANADWSESFGYNNIYIDKTFPKPDSLVLGSANNNIRCTTTSTFNIYLLIPEHADGNRRLVFVDSSQVEDDGGYLFGDWSNWTSEGKVEVNEIVPGEKYKIEGVALSANQEFKLRLFESLHDMWVGCDTFTYSDDYPVSTTEDGNCKVSKSGIYDIIVTSEDGISWNYDVLLNTTDTTQIAALAFVISFNSRIGGVCDTNGNTNIANLNAAWSDLAEEYSNLSKQVKDLLKSDLSISTATDFLEFNSKYNYVYSKYQSSLTDGNFISRDVSNANSYISTINDKDSLAISIVIASCISIISLALLVMIRKRKHQ